MRTQISLKSSAFWDKTPSRQLKIMLDLKLVSCLSYFSDPEDPGAIFLPNVG
jgi:hypothetical protein